MLDPKLVLHGICIHFQHSTECNQIYSWDASLTARRQTNSEISMKKFRTVLNASKYAVRGPRNIIVVVLVSVLPIATNKC